MIELFTADTPNGQKISIMLEETGLEYKITKINIFKDVQFSAEFKKLVHLVKSPQSSITTIKKYFEIRRYTNLFGRKTGKFYDKDLKHEINQWLMAQMGLIGPMFGQHHQFHHYNSGKSEFGEERYFKICKSLYKTLDERLKSSKFLAGDIYTIADIATWPWVARHDWHDIGIKNYPNLCKWFLKISERDAVIRGYDLLKKGNKIPMP